MENKARKQYFVNTPAADAQMIARLVTNPEMRYTPAGRPVTSFRCAVTRKYPVGEGDTREWKEKTAFYRIALWGDAGSRLNDQTLNPGDVVYVTFNLADVEAHGFKGNADEIMASVEVTASNVKVIAKAAGGDAVAADLDNAPVEETIQF